MLFRYYQINNRHIMKDKCLNSTTNTSMRRTGLGDITQNSIILRRPKNISFSRPLFHANLGFIKINVIRKLNVFLKYS